MCDACPGTTAWSPECYACLTSRTWALGPVVGLGWDALLVVSWLEWAVVTASWSAGVIGVAVRWIAPQRLTPWFATVLDSVSVSVLAIGGVVVVALAAQIVAVLRGYTRTGEAAWRIAALQPIILAGWALLAGAPRLMWKPSPWFHALLLGGAFALTAAYAWRARTARAAPATRSGRSTTGARSPFERTLAGPRLAVAAALLVLLVVTPGQCVGAGVALEAITGSDLLTVTGEAIRGLLARNDHGTLNELRVQLLGYIYGLPLRWGGGAQLGLVAVATLVSTVHISARRSAAVAARRALHVKSVSRSDAPNLFEALEQRLRGVLPTRWVVRVQLRYRGVSVGGTTQDGVLLVPAVWRRDPELPDGAMFAVGHELAHLGHGGYLQHLVGRRATQYFTWLLRGSLLLGAVGAGVGAVVSGLTAPSLTSLAAALVVWGAAALCVWLVPSGGGALLLQRELEADLGGQALAPREGGLHGLADPRAAGTEHPLAANGLTLPPASGFAFLGACVTITIAALPEHDRWAWGLDGVSDPAKIVLIVQGLLAMVTRVALHAVGATIVVVALLVVQPAGAFPTQRSRALRWFLSAWAAFGVATLLGGLFAAPAAVLGFPAAALVALALRTRVLRAAREPDWTVGLVIASQVALLPITAALAAMTADRSPLIALGPIVVITIAAAIIWQGRRFRPAEHVAIVAALMLAFTLAAARFARRAGQMFPVPETVVQDAAAHGATLDDSVDDLRAWFLREPDLSWRLTLVRGTLAAVDHYDDPVARVIACRAATDDLADALAAHDLPVAPLNERAASRCSPPGPP